MRRLWYPLRTLHAWHILSRRGLDRVQRDVDDVASQSASDFNPRRTELTGRIDAIAERTRGNREQNSRRGLRPRAELCVQRSRLSSYRQGSRDDDVAIFDAYGNADETLAGARTEEADS